MTRSIQLFLSGFLLATIAGFFISIMQFSDLASNFVKFILPIFASLTGISAIYCMVCSAIYSIREKDAAGG